MHPHLGVLLGRGVTELEHLAEHRDRAAPAALADRRQGVESRLHRGGVGVVAVVHHDQPVGPLVQRHPPRRQGPGGPEGGHDVAPGNADRERHRGRRGCVGCLVRAGLEQSQLRPGAVVPQLEGRPSELVELEPAPRHVAGDAEGQHPGRRTACHVGDQRVVGVQHGGAARCEGLDDLALRLGDRLPRAELTEVGGADVEDGRHIGGRDRTEVRDVADPAGAHLEGEEAGVGSGSQHGEWDADLVVAVALGPDRLPGGPEHLGEEVLGPGLALGARQREHGRLEYVDHVAREQPERADGIGDDHRRYAGRARAEHPGRTGLDGRGGEAVPVDVLALHRDEEPTRHHGPTVDERRSGHGSGAAAVGDRAADDVGDLGEGHRDHRRSASRATARSSKGSTTPATS